MYYQQHGDSLFLDVTAFTDDCQGLPNPEPFVNDNIILKQFDIIRKENDNLLLFVKQSTMCIKVQVFFDTLHIKNYKLYMQKYNASQDNSEVQFDVTLTMLSRFPLSKRAIYAVALSTRKDVIQNFGGKKVFLSLNETFFTDSFFHRLHRLELHQDNKYAPLFDGVTVVKIQLIQGLCSGERKPVFPLRSVSLGYDGIGYMHQEDEVCATGSLYTTQGVYRKIIPFRPGSQMKVVISCLYEQETDACLRKDAMVYITLVSKMQFDVETILQYTWTMNHDVLEWTISDFTDPKVNLAYIIVTFGVNLKQTHDPPYSTMNTDARFTTPTYSVSIPEHCRYRLQLDYLVESPARTDMISRVYTTHSHTYCFLTTCYFVHARLNSSWDSAKELCESHDYRLLTVNSDIEAKFIDGLLSSDLYSIFSPIVFLNMKQTTQVSTFLALVQTQQCPHRFRNRILLVQFVLCVVLIFTGTSINS